jgi:hypothetical protein
LLNKTKALTLSAFPGKCYLLTSTASNLTHGLKITRQTIAQ